jgi:cation diffusion facilitator CzcD-associated flavoprotein CzcO
MHLHSNDQKSSREFVSDSMRKQLDGDPRLSMYLVPQYALGCRRMTPGSDYLPSLRRSNVDVIPDSVVGVTEEGVLDASGRETKVDVIIFATGFDVTRPSYEIIGRNGRNLGEEWAEFPKGYLSIMAEGFPNMFCKFYSYLANIRARLTLPFRLDRT